MEEFTRAIYRMGRMVQNTAVSIGNTERDNWAYLEKIGAVIWLVASIVYAELQEHRNERERDQSYGLLLEAVEGFLRHLDILRMDRMDVLDYGQVSDIELD